MWYWTSGIEKRHHRFGFREAIGRDMVRNGDLHFEAAGIGLTDIEPL